MQKHMCPTCGQDGGVLLFQHVTPCDRCRLGRLTVVPFSREDGPPPGMVAFEVHYYKEDQQTLAREYVSRFANLGPGDVRPDGPNLVRIGRTLFKRPELFEKVDRSLVHFVGISVTRGAPAPDTRDPRVVGRIPDIWTGASGSQRWAEGRDVTMVLSTKDVPPERTLHTWIAYPYASAPDCSFKRLDATIQPYVRNPRMWVDGPVVKRAQEADQRFAADQILLIVRR